MAFDAFSRQALARALRLLIPVLVAFNVGFWLTDPWVFAQRPEVIAPLAHGRAALVAVGVIAWVVHLLVPRIAYVTGAVAGAATCFVTASALGEIGGPGTPWFHFLYPFVFSLLLAWLTPLMRAAATAFFGGAIVAGYFGAHPAHLDDPLAAMTLAHFSYILALSFLVGVFVDAFRLRLWVSRRDMEQARDRLEVRVAEQNRALQDFVAHLGAVQDTERANLARELHDELGQLLTAQRLVLRASMRRYETSATSIGPNLRQMEALIDQVTAHFRGMLAELRPRVLEEQGLAAALEALVAQTRDRFGLRCDLTLPVELPDPGEQRAITLYRCVQEALTNVAKHAEATRADVRLTLQAGVVTATVTDDGRGLGAGGATGLGLIGIRERAEAQGGTVDVRSEPGIGTTVTVLLPLAAPRSEPRPPAMTGGR